MKVVYRNFDVEQKSVQRFLSIDPLAEKFSTMSPYNYVANNPIIFIDPDGRDLIIWYQTVKKNESGGVIESKNHYFKYDGTNASKAPNNIFVQNVIKAHQYNVKNGGGDNIDSLVKDDKNLVNVIDAGNGTSRGGLSEGKPIIIFNDGEGLELKDGNILSPATVLEHEAAHTKAAIEDNKAFNERLKTPDDKYSNKEEKRVIQGAETKTAKANGEIPKSKKYTRSCYGCDDANFVRVKSVTSNKKIN